MKFILFLWKVLATFIAYTYDNKDKELVLFLSLVVIVLEMLLD